MENLSNNINIEKELNELDINKNIIDKIVIKKSDQNIAIVYHYPCYDGSYSALNTYLYYHNFCKLKSHIKFYPSNNQNRISEVNYKEADKIYVLDKGLNDEDYTFLYEIAKENKNLKIILIDHHSSSINIFNKNYKNQYDSLSNIKFIFDDLGIKSASGLTFDYFKNKSLKNFAKEKVEAIFTQNYEQVKHKYLTSF